MPTQGKAWPTNGLASSPAPASRLTRASVAATKTGMAETLIFDRPVTLAGGAPFDLAALDAALALAPVLVAADAGDHRLDELGRSAEAVIGDMDSAPASRAHVVHITEQETTDFEKCLYTVQAPFFIGVGFTGGRLDHTLAVLHAMLRRPVPPVVLLGEADAITLLPPAPLRLSLAPGDTVSLFPLRTVRGVASSGLRWPIDGLVFAPGERIGTSNLATAEDVTLEVDGPGMVLTVPRARLSALVASMTR